MGKLRNLAEGSPESRRNVIRRIVHVLTAYAIMGLSLFIPAGRADWLYGWLYMLAYLFIMLIGAYTLPLDVMAERGRRKSNVEPWDKVIQKLLMVTMIATFIVAGLDFRWAWSADVGKGLRVAALLVFLLGVWLDIWAMISNRFFSTEVRIQFDRGHTVCSWGPYRHVRHPGYAGMIIYMLATPVFLGSTWAIIPSLLTAVLFVVRTALEDRTLMEKLPGYAEYALTTRYRLIPWLW